MTVIEDFTGNCRGIKYDYTVYATDSEIVLESYVRGHMVDRVTWNKTQSNYKLILSLIEDIKSR